MRRFRMSTLMLLIVIAALGIALMLEHRRASRREAELQARLAQSWPLFLKLQQTEQRLLILVQLRAQYQEVVDQLELSAAHAQRQSK